MKKEKIAYAILSGIVLICFLSSCGTEETDGMNQNPINVNYTPINNNDGWKISTPQEQGMDEGKLKNVYEAAGKISNIYSLLIVKNDCLIGEAYFNSDFRGIDTFTPLASVTKSYTSALTGIAIREGYIKDVDQKMRDFFPEFNWDQMDSRKSQISIENILQMRSGYPWEERTGYMEILFSAGNWLPFIERFPLLSNPGSEFGYSNFTAHMMAVIVARATGMNLKDFANTHLFDPLDVTVKNWPQDTNGYYYGSGDISFIPRDMARFGLLYLNKGYYNGTQIIPADWVEASFKIYS